MNKILTVLTAAVALAFCSCAGTAPRIYSAPSAGVVKQHVDATGAKITEAQTHVIKATTHAKAAKAKVEQVEKIVPKTSENAELILSLKSEIDSLTDELLNTQLALKDAQDETQKAQAEIPKLQEQINAQTTALNQVTKEKNDAVAKYEAARKSYHKLKFWIIGVAAAAVVFLIYSLFHFAAFTPPILYLTIAAPVAVSTFLLFYL